MMMKRRRPKEHIRRLHTRHGIKRRRINIGIAGRIKRRFFKKGSSLKWHDSVKPTGRTIKLSKSGKEVDLYQSISNGKYYYLKTYADGKPVKWDSGELKGKVMYVDAFWLNKPGEKNQLEIKMTPAEETEAQWENLM